MSTGPQAAPLRMTASWFGALGLPKESTEYWVEVVNSWAWDLAFAKACSDFGEVTQLAAAATLVRFLFFAAKALFNLVWKSLDVAARGYRDVRAT